MGEEIQISLLEKVPLFESCSQSVLISISKYMKLRTIPKNEYIIKMGDPSNEMFFIIRGRVSVTIGTDKLSVVADLPAGSFFGEMGILNDTPRVASVEAVTLCELYVLTREDFKIIQKDYPEIVAKVKEVAERRFEWFKLFLKEKCIDPSQFTIEQIERFRQVYSDIDLDQNGFIDYREFSLLLHRLSGKELTPQELDLIMGKLDIDRNRSIDFGEFLSGLRHLRWIVGDVRANSSFSSKSTSSNSFLFMSLFLSCVVLGFAAIFVRYKYVS